MSAPSTAVGEDGTVFCPLCNAWQRRSEYLGTVFPLPDRWREYWIATMTSHYRHIHVSYYNRWVGYHGRYRSYEGFKHEVNERAKRQLIRKSAKFLRGLGIGAEHFDALQGTTPETRRLAMKMLGHGRAELPKGQSAIDDFRGVKRESAAHPG